MSHRTHLMARQHFSCGFRRMVVAGCASTLVASWSLPASADSFAWIGLGATDNWTNPSNWDPLDSEAQFAPVQSLEETTLYFGSSTTARFHPDLNQNWRVKSLHLVVDELFGSRDVSFELHSSNNSTLTLGDGGIQDDKNSGDVISHAIALGDDQIWVANNLSVTGARSGTFTLNINAVLTGCQRAGPCHRTMEGRGGFIFLGGNGAAETGDIHVWGGTLAIAGGDAVSAQSTVVVHEGATLDLLSSSEQVGALQGAGRVRIGLGALDAGIKGTQLKVPAIDEFSGQLEGIGRFTKSGLGVMRLTGDNSGFSGAVNVSEGELQIGGANDSLSGQSRVTIAAGATLRIQGDGETFGSLTGAGKLVVEALTGVGTNNATTTFSGELSGAGPFVKFGSGALTLTGNNTLTGTVSVLAGDLFLLAGDNVSDVSTVEVAAGARLVIDEETESMGGLAGAGEVNVKRTLRIGANNASSTFSGRLLGAGDITKQGAGKLILSGRGDHHGHLAIEGGALEIGGSADTLSDTDAVTVGAGATLRIAGNGEDFGALDGAGAVELAANMGVGADNTATTYGGSMSGAGRFTKNGRARMTLTGSSSLDGDVMINDGMLALAPQGALAIGGVMSFVHGAFALEGGTLSAHTINLNRGSFIFSSGELHVDTFIGDLINDGGTLAPGHSPGITAVIGDYAQSAAGTLAIELASDSAFDQLFVQGGSATLDGRLTVQLLDGFDPGVGSVFDILVADGGIRGAFASLLFPQLSNKHFELDTHLPDRLSLRVVAATSSTTPVPLSPALAFLGSGLASLVGLARRRRAT